jgi:sec-independent protein translocase protein TatA
VGSLSPMHLIIVLVIALLVIGPGKLPEVGAALGNSIREFRRATTDVPDSAPLGTPPSSPTPAALQASSPIAVHEATASNGVGSDHTTQLGL